MNKDDSCLAQAHIRIARPTHDLESVLNFYRDGLGFELLGEFENHDGFDGKMLGHKNAAYHLEFTRKSGEIVGRCSSQDILLVFYAPDKTDWQKMVDRLESHGYPTVQSFNPYWDRHGKTFEDPDGYRVVLHNTNSPI